MAILSRRPPRRDGWDSTHWSVLCGLRTREDPVWETAWTYLVETYRPPMEVFARRVYGLSTGRDLPTEEAAEIVQDFLATCVEKNWLARADRERGRFRGFVRTLLRRHVYHRIRHDTAQKRHPGPGQKLVPLAGHQPAESPATDELALLDEFTVNWVKVAVDRALERLGAEQRRYYDVLTDLLATDGEGSDDLAERMGIRHEQLPVLKHRARQRFAKFLTEELARTVDSQASFEEEWRALHPFLP